MKISYLTQVILTIALALANGFAQGDTEQTIILIALDGFRWDYPERTETPNLDYLIENGVRAKSLIPAFPTKTFPNFYTIVTGLYPDNHGIVANNMHDLETNQSFSLSNREAVRHAGWWGGEPIWVTAEKNKIKTAAYFWPGSEAAIMGLRPSYWQPYAHFMPNESRIDQIFELLALPVAERPRLLTHYFSLLDDAGHLHRPESDEVTYTIAEADRLVGVLLTGLRHRKLLDHVNIMIVSDHGMSATSRNRVIFLDDYIDLKQAKVIDWTPVAAINPLPAKPQKIYDKLKNAHPNMQVYRRHELPARFHYGKNKRVPEIIAIAEKGWSISSRGYYAQNPAGFDGGTHGYDNFLPEMGAIFIASGPAFKSGTKVPSLGNVHLYELMTRILGLQAAPNNGSLDSIKVMLKDNFSQNTD